ncbi:MAG: ABC transporter substrate-binding protein [Deferribacteraceae bacterium]|jgi:sulfonate transport system substrate-binding protein|nr:ABC transporter substrate-binding protein [Deferribacteraceae bacterium]
MHFVRGLKKMIEFRTEKVFSLKRTMILLAILSLIIFGCTKKDKTQDITVKIGYFPANTWSAQIPIAYKKGFFDEAFAGENIKIDFFSFVNGPAANEAFAAGELDIVNGIGDQPIIAGIGNGLKITVVSPTSAQGKNIGVIVSDNSPINGVEDLKNKKIGVYTGTYVHKSLLGILSDVGIAEEDVGLMNISAGNDGISALSRGDIDAYIPIQALLIDQARKQGLGKHIATFENYPAYAFIVANTDFLQKNTELVQKFLKAIYRAQLWIDKNREESYEILGDFYGISTEGARLNNQGADIFLGISDKEYEQLRYTCKFLTDKGLIHTKIDDLDAHIDGTLINDVIRNYK